MKSKNVIEINGKLYDARTGSPLHPAKKAPASAKKTSAVAKAAPARRKSIDGFSPRTGGGVKLHPTKKVVATQKATPKKMAARTQTASSAKLTAKRSTTLNRNVVSAPKISVAAPVETIATSEKTSDISSTALKQADVKRLQRAQSVTKSSIISRFSTAAPKTAQQLPKEVLQTKTAEKTVTSPQNKAAEKTVTSLSTKERLIKTALENAVTTAHAHTNNHAKTHKKKSKHHIARYTSTALVVLVLAAYVAYLNVPSISMKVAANRAGFAASLPTYKPAGYSLRGPIAYSPGQVTLNFASNTDQRNFSLTQQPTTWDSTALLENHVTKKSANYLTYQDSGLTIYILDNGDAAWVNGGKFYQVKASKTSLDTNQLLKLATGA